LGLSAKLRPESDGQALAALGATRIDDGAAAASLHAHEKAMGTGAADFGSLVGAFHVDSFWSAAHSVTHRFDGLLVMAAPK
jgi:hypothetical protein